VKAKRSLTTEHLQISQNVQRSGSAMSNDQAVTGDNLMDELGQLRLQVADLEKRRREQEEAVSRLERSEQRFRSLVERVASGIAIVDAEGRMLYVSNSDSWRVWRRRMGDVGGWDSYTFIHPSDRARMARNIRLSLQEPEKPILATYRARHGDGTWHVVETVLTNLTDDPKVGGLVVSFRDATESKRTERALRRLSSQVLRAQEAERGRIALELHDHVGSELAFLEMELAGLARNLRGDCASRRQVLELLAVVGRIKNDCHQIVVSLGWRMLYELGLVRSLEWYVEDFERRTGISSVIDTPTLDIETDRACALAAYRIVQEALANVWKHSNATQVEVSVRQKNGVLCLSVADNGVGFDSARLSQRSCLGLGGMKERAMLVGGKVKISSSTGKGTRIDARLPNRCKGTLNHSISQGEEDDNDTAG